MNYIKKHSGFLCLKEHCGPFHQSSESAQLLWVNPPPSASAGAGGQLAIHSQRWQKTPAGSRVPSQWGCSLRSQAAWILWLSGWEQGCFTYLFIFKWFSKNQVETGFLLERCHILTDDDDEQDEEVAQSCPTLCNPIDCRSLPRSSIHGILQARVLEWVAISFSRGSSRPRDRTQVYLIVGRRFTIWATREVSLFS